MHRFALFILTALLIPACSSHYGAAKIISVPSGVRVVNDADGKYLGVTPLTTWWKNSSGNREHVILHFEQAGYYSKTSSFWLSMSHGSAKDALQTPTLVETTMQEKDQ